VALAPVEAFEDVDEAVHALDAGDERLRVAAAAAQQLALIYISETTRPLSISYAVFCLKKKKV